MYPERDDRKVIDRVEEILNQDEKARNDDIYLIFLYWEKFQGLDIDPNEASRILRNSESIRRARQSIQEEGRYPPTDQEVKDKRRK